jgi:hypothetical protein
MVLTRENYPDQFEDLRDGFPARFAFAPDAKNGSDHPLHCKADVRLTQVRVFFPGLPCATPPLTVKLMHGGHEYINNPKGDIVEFRHNRRGFAFAYTPPEKGPLVDEKQGYVMAEALLKGGSLDGSFGMPGDRTALPECSYTPLGPFTEWTIEVPEEDNPNLEALRSFSTDLSSKIVRS